MNKKDLLIVKPIVFEDGLSFSWGKCRPCTGKNTRSLWHLLKQYKTPAIKAFVRRTWTDGHYYSVCTAQYWQEQAQEFSNQAPQRADACSRCYKIAKKYNLFRNTK